MSHPNLLVIHTDQQSPWTLGAYGGTLVETPHIDLIGHEGAVFNSFFTNSAVCTPSRGCLLTGRYPHCHGAYANNIPLNRDEVTFAHALLQEGYETGYAGKWHLDGPLRPGWVHPERSMGFTDNRYMFNRGHWKKIEGMPMQNAEPMVFPYRVIGDERTYTTDWLTERTIEFILQPRTAPFCYMVSIPDPHGPVEVRAPYDTMYRPEDMTLPATFDQKDLPRWAERFRQRGPYAPSNPHREEDLRRKKALYCGEVKLIDDCVGRLMDCLQQQGILDETVVVFTTDHGDYMGEHGLHAKNQLYETVYRLPLLVRWPEKIAKGTVIDQIVSTVDFQRTILGLMGVEPCGREQGRDASPLLRDEEIEWEDEAFVHHASLERAGIFTPEFELAYVKEDEAILFDRRNDPNQENNLSHCPEHRDVIGKLTERIIRHHEELDSPAAGWLKAVRSQKTCSEAEM